MYFISLFFNGDDLLGIFVISNSIVGFKNKFVLINVFFS